MHKKSPTFDSELKTYERMRAAIKTLYDNGKLECEGKTSDVTYEKKKFNWKRFRFDPERWIVREVYVYTDPLVRFPIFDWKEHIFYTESELNQFLLLEQLHK